MLANAPALAPYGAALLDAFAGRAGSRLGLRSSLGEDDDLPIEVFFRGEDDLFDFEPPALEACRGRVLDAGAGAGVHSLLLQRAGRDATAVEVVPEAVEILRLRGCGTLSRTTSSPRTSVGSTRS